MAKSGIEVDLKEFNKALLHYEVASKKSAEQVANDKLRDWLFKASASTAKAKAGEISRLKQEDWWFKYIASLVIKKHGKGTLNKKQFRKEAKALSAKLIRNRKRTITYLKAGFIHSAKKVMDSGEKREGKEKPVKVKSFKAITNKVKLANKTRPYAEAITMWGSEDANDKAEKEKILNAGMREGMNKVTRDMQKYLERKIREQALKYSGK